MAPAALFLQKRLEWVSCEALTRTSTAIPCLLKATSPGAARREEAHRQSHRDPVHHGSEDARCTEFIVPVPKSIAHQGILRFRSELTGTDDPGMACVQGIALASNQPCDAMVADRPAWTIDRAHYPKASGHYEMSEHALRRMYARSLSEADVRRTLHFGRVVFARGAVHFVLGKNEVGRYEAVEPEDDGLQVAVSELGEGTVLTLYRNREEMPRS